MSEDSVWSEHEAEGQDPEDQLDNVGDRSRAYAMVHRVRLYAHYGVTEIHFHAGTWACKYCGWWNPPDSEKCEGYLYVIIGSEEVLEACGRLCSQASIGDD